MHRLEWNLKLLDALVDLRDDRNHSCVLEVGICDALETGEHWILQFPAK